MNAQPALRLQKSTLMIASAVIFIYLALYSLLNVSSQLSYATFRNVLRTNPTFIAQLIQVAAYLFMGITAALIAAKGNIYDMNRRWYKAVFLIIGLLVFMFLGGLDIYQQLIYIAKNAALLNYEGHMPYMIY